MKRAHLTLPSAPPAPEAADLTDRLLDGAKSKRQKAGRRYAKQKAQPQTPELSAPSSASIRSSVDSSADSSASIRSREAVDTSADSPLDTALTQSRAAVDALHAAAAEAPARYNVALHYRLDALAHHLTQITEFIETLRK